MEQYLERIKELEKRKNPLFIKHKKKISDIIEGLEKAKDNAQESAKLAKLLSGTLSSIEAYESSLAAQTQELNTVMKTGPFGTKAIGVGEIKERSKKRNLNQGKIEKTEHFYDDLLKIGIPKKPYSRRNAVKASRISKWHENANKAGLEPSNTTPFEAAISRSIGVNIFSRSITKLHKLFVNNQKISEYDLEGRLTKAPKAFRYVADGVKNITYAASTLFILPYVLYKHYKKILEGGGDEK